MGRLYLGGACETGKLFPTEEGAPQGGIVSPTLANWTLDGLEVELEAHFGSKGNHKAGRCKVNLVRYADDFVITGSSKELLQTEVKPLVERFLSIRGLELSPEKTKMTHIAEGFDFLGQNVRSFDGKVIQGQGQGDIRGEQNRQAGEPDRRPQSGDPGLGELSPSGMCFADFRLDRLVVVVEDMAMGQAEASQQKRQLDQREILCENR